MFSRVVIAAGHERGNRDYDEQHVLQIELAPSERGGHEADGGSRIAIGVFTANANGKWFHQPRSLTSPFEKRARRTCALA